MTKPAAPSCDYVVSFAKPGGTLGTVHLTFAFPITAEDWPEVDRLVSGRHPGAIPLGFSLFAPSRTKGQPVEVPVRSSDFARLVGHARRLSERLHDLEEKIKTLRTDQRG